MNGNPNNPSPKGNWNPNQPKQDQQKGQQGQKPAQPQHGQNPQKQGQSGQAGQPEIKKTGWCAAHKGPKAKCSCA